MAANPTPYEMPCPVADYYDPDDGPTATFAEEPPDAVLSVASSLMEAEIDTSCCASCGAPIGYVLVEVRDRYDSGTERVTWVTPWLVVDRSGTPAAVCEDCSEDAATLAAVEDVPPLRYPPTHKLRQAIASQAVAADPSVWRTEVTLGRQMLAARAAGLRARGRADGDGGRLYAGDPGRAPGRAMTLIEDLQTARDMISDDMPDGDRRDLADLINRIRLDAQSAGIPPQAIQWISKAFEELRFGGQEAGLRLARLNMTAAVRTYLEG